MDSELPEEKWAQLRVYPNPASDEVTIDVDAFMGQKVNITLYSLTGQMISRHLIEEVQMPNETILLHNLESGTYLLRLETKDRSLSQKLVVQKF